MDVLIWKQGKHLDELPEGMSGIVVSLTPDEARRVAADLLALAEDEEEAWQPTD